MTLAQALLLAVVQGATELFPVSSLGHAVLLPALLGWHLDQAASTFLPFLVMLHLGTATALFAYFWRDWIALARGLFGLGDPARVDECRRMVLLMVLATLPAVLIGGLGEHALRHLFAAPLLVSLALVANGVLLLVVERLRRAATHRPLSSLVAADAIAIGLWQCLALVPGLSRSGATIGGGLLRGIDHEAAAHFSFLIALPIILGATVLEVPKLRHADVPPGMWQLSVIAAIVAGLVAFASTAALLRWFRGHDRGGLVPFGLYCIVAGLCSGALLAFA